MRPHKCPPLRRQLSFLLNAARGTCPGGGCGSQLLRGEQARRTTSGLASLKRHLICRLRDAKPLCVSPLCLQLKPSDSVSPGRQGTIGTGIQTPCTGIKALALSSPARDALAGSKGAGLGPERSSGSLVRSPREAGRRRETDPLGWRPLLGDHVGPDSSCVPTATQGTFRL